MLLQTEASGWIRRCAESASNYFWINSQTSKFRLGHGSLTDWFVPHINCAPGINTCSSRWGNICSGYGCADDLILFGNAYIWNVTCRVNCQVCILDKALKCMHLFNSVRHSKFYQFEKAGIAGSGPAWCFSGCVTEVFCCCIYDLDSRWKKRIFGTRVPGCVTICLRICCRNLEPFSNHILRIGLLAKCIISNFISVLIVIVPVSCIDHHLFIIVQNVFCNAGSRQNGHLSETYGA